MADEFRIAMAKERYQATAHAMQSGVAFSMANDPTETTPKHLRVGINSAMVEHSALVGLLIKKGLITEVEYYEALADSMEAEAKRYQQRLSQIYGRDVELQ